MVHAVTASQPVSHLPVELTGFVGRRQDRADVRRLLSSSRLVTLTGFGGIGKTRLAVRVAGELSRLYADGVCFVPFGDLSDPALVPDTVAAALGLQDHGSSVDAQRLAERLREREVLLVLDNCEHLVDACADLVGVLLRHCPRLHILATSREALRIQGEAVRALLPLSVPSRVEGALAGLEAYESIQLMVDRAGQVAPGFAISDQNAAAVIEICRHLDGIPLALELAAVRLRALSPAELLHELRTHWQSLDVGIRGAPDRHRTMAACLGWSHSLCEPDEQELWALLSVFAGGMEMDAIQYMAAGSPGPLPPDRVAHVIESLVDKSILVAEQGEDRMRYRMLEVIRRFGVSSLGDAGRLPTTRARHRDWAAQMLTLSDEQWASEQQLEAMTRVRREVANIRAALQFCVLEPGQAAAGLDLAGRLRKYSMSYGWFSEDRLWLERLLPEVHEASQVRFGGLHAACWAAVLQGDREAAGTLLAEVHELAAQLDEPTPSRAEQVAGWHDIFLGDLSSAVHHLERAIEGFRAIGWSVEVADTLVFLGMAHAFAGDYDKAAAAHEECLHVCVDGANLWARSYALLWGGLVAWEMGEPEKALLWEKESLKLKRQMQEPFGVALCLEALACMESNHVAQRAAIMFGAATSLLTMTGTTPAALPGLLTYHEASDSKLRETLGDTDFVRAFEHGAALSVEEAIAFALEEHVPTKPTSREESGSAVLTRREREIALLIADGLSNKDIASRLVISKRTAEGHVEHILTKLGFTSRTQVATWVANYADKMQK
jgi:predicted ATPase/DNA-binding CsgD family transcriptional regulator